MRLLIFTLSLLFMLGANAQKTYVLVVGVSSYQDSRMNVTQTTKNAKSFAQKMKTQEGHLSWSTEYRPHRLLLCRSRWSGRNSDRLYMCL